MNRRISRPTSRSDRPADRNTRGRAGSEQPRGDRPKSDRPQSDRPATGRTKPERFKTDRVRDDRPHREPSKREKPHGERPAGFRGESDRPRDDRPRDDRASGNRTRGDRNARDARKSADWEPRERSTGPRVGNKPPRSAPARAERRSAPPPPPVEAIKPEPEAAPLPTKVQTIVVTDDENNMRVDRFLEAHFPGLSFSHIQRIVRKGELRVNGKRADSKDRLEVGQSVRIPPLKLDAPKVAGNLSEAEQKTLDALKAMILYQDDDVMVLNKPSGLAVQGGSGTTRHIDLMLEVMRDAKGQKPRLVHRIDKDTSGCLVVAKTRFAATQLTGAFRHRSARKVYWALVAGVPKPKQGRISTYLAKEESEDDTIMRVAAHGDEGASHAVTYYAVVEASASKLSWVSLKPVTGRTHQLRAHMDHIGHPIVGDPKYFNIENWHLPGGLQNRLHLLARRIVIPHPRGGMIDVTAPLPPHMLQSWNLLGLEADRFDPIENAPEE